MRKPVNKNKEFKKNEIKNSVFTQPVKAGVSEMLTNTGLQAGEKNAWYNRTLVLNLKYLKYK